MDSFCNPGPFFTLWPSYNVKNQNFEKMIKLLRDTIILHLCTTNSIIWCMFPEKWSETATFFCHFGLFFTLSPPLPHRPPLTKNGKNTLRYYQFTHVYYKSKSYAVWFLRYGPQQTEYFAWRYRHFTPVDNNWQSYDVCFLRYEARQTQFFVILGHFLHFYPTNNPRKSKF